MGEGVGEGAEGEQHPKQRNNMNYESYKFFANKEDAEDELYKMVWLEGAKIVQIQTPFDDTWGPYDPWVIQCGEDLFLRLDGSIW